MNEKDKDPTELVNWLRDQAKAEDDWESGGNTKLACFLEQAADELEELRAFKNVVVADSFRVLLDASDVFAWGVSDCIELDIEIIPLLIEMRQRWGDEGKFALLAEIRKREPQEPWFAPRTYGDNREPYLDRAKYAEAREFVRGKNVGDGESMALDQHRLDAELFRLRKENAALKTRLYTFEANPLG